MTATRAPAALAVLVSGNGSNLQSIINHCERGELDARIVAVISDNADAHGLTRARRHGIPAHGIPPRPDESRDEYGRRLAEIIEAHTCGFIALAGFMRVLSGGFVRRYLGRMLNIHPSLLPRHRGLNTHQRALDCGDREHGASVHFVTPRLDSGPVIMQARVTVRADDDAESLAKRVLAREHRLYPAALRLCLAKRIRYDRGAVKLDNKILPAPLMLDACTLA